MVDYAERLFKIKQLEHKLDVLVFKINNLRDIIGLDMNHPDSNECHKTYALLDNVKDQISKLLEID